MAHEIMFYAIVQKEDLGFDKAVEEAKARMSRYSVKPNMLVVPPQLLLYMATAPSEKIKFSDAGPDGPARFDAGVAGYEARAFRELGVFTSTPYEVSDGAASLDPTIGVHVYALTSATPLPVRHGFRADASAIDPGRRVLPHVGAAGVGH
tara:strand:- start:470 stop:919 length:450 start_codon:yes stop_codon:yes gene_type:complete